MERRGRQAFSVKNMITTLPDSAGSLIAPDVRVGDPIMLNRQRLTIRSLVAPGNTNSNLVEYPRQTLRDLNAAVVSKGTLKAESNIEYTLEDAPVRTIAHWTKISRQALSDAKQIASIIDSELRYGLALAEETEMLFGDGNGQHLFGIVSQAATFSSPIGAPERPN